MRGGLHVAFGIHVKLATWDERTASILPDGVLGQLHTSAVLIRPYTGQVLHYLASGHHE